MALPYEQMKPSDDQMTMLMMESPLLDDVEAYLRHAKKDVLAANRLLKLQQDIVTESFNPDGDENDAGTQTEAFYEAYKKQNTLLSSNKILCETRDALPKGKLKTEMSRLIKELQPPKASSPAPKQKPFGV
jgi:hypothetical protein